ncbi:acetyltransferase [Paenibacillus sediminis]|uniref:UDP-perosamine 4-acetyltransferase n=1 Tax=Paenibacillus sediminis TaxID=664909 RepID=A0ABS4H258_9BACL|nr:UDP-perosamine 4-acetyltransferase [Paenibacillus sediminis]
MHRNKVVIIGGGGHAKVVIDVIQSADTYELVGFTSHSDQESNLSGIPYLGDDSILPTLLEEGVQYFFVATGNNRLRKKLFYQLIELGFTPINAISPFARISPFAKLGRGIVVMPGAVINAYAVIEDNVIINTLSGIDHDCLIKPHAHIAPGASLAGCVNVGEGAFVGMKSSVIPEISIGEWSVVGAGAAVISDVPSYVTVVGVPAKKIIVRNEER